jgi:hypothetical protein
MATTIKVLPQDPLNHDVPIVDERGRPTPAFIQQWQKSRNIALTVEETAVAVEEVSGSLDSDYYTKVEVDEIGIPFVLNDGTQVKLPLEH